MADAEVCLVGGCAWCTRRERWRLARTGLCPRCAADPLKRAGEGLALPAGRRCGDTSVADTVGLKLVTVKLLPFDNKSELQVVVDLPRGTSLEETDQVLDGAARRLGSLKELASIQSYAGTASAVQLQRAGTSFVPQERTGAG